MCKSVFYSLYNILWIYYNYCDLIGEPLGLEFEIENEMAFNRLSFFMFESLR